MACLESCCIFAHGQITGGFNNLHFPLLPAILLYFQTLPTHWWLQLLKFAPVACNLVVVSNKIFGGVNNLNVPPIACNLVVAWNLVVFSHVVASITSIFPRCLQSSCNLKQCKLTGRLPAILLYFQTLRNDRWLAWNLGVSHMAK